MKTLTFSMLEKYGRLGNQLFEIASMIGLANRYNAKPLIKPDWKYREYFNIPEEYYGIDKYNQQVTEDKFNYIPNLLENTNSDCVDVVGTFQSERYFEPIKDRIKQYLTPNNTIDLEENSVAIHWRLGDYLNNQAYAQYGAGYYLSAINKYFRNGNYKFYIVSDDIEHCKKHFIGDEYIIEKRSEIEDLKILIGCKHHILSASTFSWWGAYLSNSKLVIRPPKIFSGTLKDNYEGDFWQKEWVIHSNHKPDLMDTTFIIPVKYDSKDRKENLKITVDFIQKNFNTNIIIGEQGGRYFKLDSVKYINFPYKEFHRTKMLNRMTKISDTSIVINWDADVLLSPFQIYKMVEMLRKNYDFVYPYDGRFLRVGDGIYKRNTSLIDKSKIGDVGVFCRYNFVGEKDHSVGGVVGYKKQSFIDAGMENENFIAYAPEDIERYYRFKELGYVIGNVSGALYHLNHYCSQTSSTKNPFYKQGCEELAKIRDMNCPQLCDYINTWAWIKEPKIVFVTYANAEYFELQARLVNIAEQSGNFDEIYTYTEDWLHTTHFYNDNKNILDQHKGAGYWLWKPYIISKALEELNEGDILFYLDCGDVITGDVRSFLLERMKDKDILLTYGSFKNADWTKGDCFYLMSCDEERYWNSIQLEAGIFVCKKGSDDVNDLLLLWTEYCRNENIITDKPNEYRDNISTFEEHRHDQSILTNLKVKYELYSSSEMRQFVRCNVPFTKELSGVTYIIPVFYDSKERQLNLDCVVRYLNTIGGKIIIGELLEKRFSYLDEVATYVTFYYDTFHRTKMLNAMVDMTDSDIIVICDADVIVPELQINEAVRLISTGEYDVVYPYDKFTKLTKEQTLKFRGEYNFEDLAGQKSHGGMIFFNKKVYQECGGENEKFISWGLEDLELVNRLKKLNYKLKRLNGNLYHLDHYRSINSSKIHPDYENNKLEYQKVSSMSTDEVKEYVKSWKN